MPRAIIQDFLHVYKFIVSDSEKFFTPAAGFSRMSIPEVSVEVVEYREGHDTWTRKQPGIPSVGECTLARGVVIGGTNFFDLILKHINGENYRTDINVYHIHKSHKSNESATARVYKLLDAFISSITTTSELDASSSDIAVTEMTIVGEELQVSEEGVTFKRGR
jgi:phage tail-like protein